MSLNHALVEDLFKKIIGPFGAMSLAPFMIEPEDSEDRVRLLSVQLNQHPTLIPAFSALIKSLNTSQEDIDTVLEEKIRFYQTKHTRNWLIVNLMNHILNVKELKLDLETGRLPGKPHDLIKFANQAQVAFGEESRYKDQAFAGGLLFDFLFYLQRTPYLDLGQTKFDELINQAFARAVQQGKMIATLAKHKPKLSLERVAFLTPFFRQLAQVSLYLLKPNEAPEFYKKFNTMKHTEGVRLALEMKTFGIHTGIIAAYLAQTVQLFGQLGEVMSIWGAPYLSWVHGHREVHDLAAIGLLGVTADEQLRGSDFPIPGPIGISVPELKYLDLTWDVEIKREIKI